MSGDVFSRESLTEDVRSTLILDENASVPFVYDEGGRLYPQRFFLEELTLAQRFCRLASMPAVAATGSQTALLDAMAAADRAWVESTLAPELAPELRALRLSEAKQSEADQRAAVLSAVTRRFTVVCGGPGTGKTTSVSRFRTGSPATHGFLTKGRARRGPRSVLRTSKPAFASTRFTSGSRCPSRALRDRARRLRWKRTSSSSTKPR